MAMPEAHIDLQRATGNLMKVPTFDTFLLDSGFLAAAHARDSSVAAFWHRMRPREGEACWGERLAMQFFRQLVMGVAFIHENSVIHRDLKPENILMTADGQLQVADFGWSTRVSRNVGRALAGTYVYMSPEVLDGRKHSTKADIWGLGMILWFLLYGGAMLDQNIIGPGVTQLTAADPVRSAQLRARIVRERIDQLCPLRVEERPADLPWHIWLLLRDLVATLPSIRPEASEILLRIDGEGEMGANQNTNPADEAASSSRGGTEGNAHMLRKNLSSTSMNSKSTTTSSSSSSESTLNVLEQKKSSRGAIIKTHAMSTTATRGRLGEYNKKTVSSTSGLVVSGAGGGSSGSRIDHGLQTARDSSSSTKEAASPTTTHQQQRGCHALGSSSSSASSATLRRGGIQRHRESALRRQSRRGMKKEDSACSSGGGGFGSHETSPVMLHEGSGAACNDDTFDGADQNNASSPVPMNVLDVTTLGEDASLDVTASPSRDHVEADAVPRRPHDGQNNCALTGSMATLSTACDGTSQLTRSSGATSGCASSSSSSRSPPVTNDALGATTRTPSTVRTPGGKLYEESNGRGRDTATTTASDAKTAHRRSPSSARSVESSKRSSARVSRISSHSDDNEQETSKSGVLMGENDNFQSHQEYASSQVEAGTILSSCSSSSKESCSTSSDLAGPGAGSSCSGTSSTSISSSGGQVQQPQAANGVEQQPRVIIRTGEADAAGVNHGAMNGSDNNETPGHGGMIGGSSSSSTQLRASRSVSRTAQSRLALHWAATQAQQQLRRARSSKGSLVLGKRTIGGSAVETPVCSGRRVPFAAG
ncbi:unnamed protein product [Amoebophrya sp. A25]|nr:unnamed protein product [Amoebophrya sp. A25]|eukprot:GSA25T00018683001.1